MKKLLQQKSQQQKLQASNDWINYVLITIKFILVNLNSLKAIIIGILFDVREP